MNPVRDATETGATAIDNKQVTWAKDSSAPILLNELLTCGCHSD
jgi:hypothetical protein